VGIAREAVGVYSTAAGAGVEKSTSHGREVHPAAAEILQFLETADPAPIAQRFPLLGRHFLKRFLFPEGIKFHGLRPLRQVDVLWMALQSVVN